MTFVLINLSFLASADFCSIMLDAAFKSNVIFSHLESF